MNSILLAATSSSAGMGLFKPLYWLFGVCMGFLMDLLNNQYFVAIVIFTVVTRVILLPFNIHQQKTMAKTARLQPKLAKLQKKYPDPKDRMKLQQETQDLYAREGHNPMQMGCGPMLFQMVFLMGIIGIIYYPLSYVLGISPPTLRRWCRSWATRASICSWVFWRISAPIRTLWLRNSPPCLLRTTAPPFRHTATVW